MPNPLKRLGSFFNRLVSTLKQTFLHLTQPAHYSIALSIVADLPRSKSQLIAENALLRQQLIILHRQVKKPRFTVRSPMARPSRWPRSALEGRAPDPQA